ncbi:unnamed protein product [Lactuca virosa]|uniref:Uncharacterized protein n=1 Tax=Lactuca virosa TaxID=75947 RepID=A0AAU9NZ06_9ASTR|nr:unnamed protein product [Lactuca virosa]
MIGVFSLAAHARPSSSACLHLSGQLTSPPMSFLTLPSSDIEFPVLSSYVAADEPFSTVSFASSNKQDLSVEEYLFLFTCPNEIHGFDSSCRCSIRF